MRLFGHPVHVMLIHFPVALWPAHAGLHFLAGRLPPGVAGIAGFWLLVAGTGLGWLAACFGLSDLLAIQRAGQSRRLSYALSHGLVNGTVLTGFTAVAVAEYPHYPAITHGPGFLAIEVALLVGLFIGNYLGGEVVWKDDGGRKRE